MASYIMHAAVSQEVAKHFNINPKKFLYGNLLPDSAFESYASKQRTHFRIDKESYESSQASYYQYYDHEAFLKKYHKHMHNDIYLGYYCHLLTDEIWIQRIYIKYMRDENRSKRLDQQANYYHDYDRLNPIVRKIYSPSIEVEVAEHHIEEVADMSFDKVLEGIKRCSTLEFEDTSLKLFDQMDILEVLKDMIRLITNSIEEKGLRVSQSDR